MLSSALWNFAIIGFAICGMVYVPIPAWMDVGVGGTWLDYVAYLIVDKLLFRVVLLQHREKVDNVGILKEKWYQPHIEKVRKEVSNIIVKLVAWTKGYSQKGVAGFKKTWPIPVPSKQSTNVRWRWLGGIVGSVYCESELSADSPEGDFKGPRGKETSDGLWVKCESPINNFSSMEDNVALRVWGI